MQSSAVDKWPTIEEAAHILNTSLRTMWRHAQAHRIELQKRPCQGRKPENVVNPRDIERLMPQAYVLPEPVQNNDGLSRINEEHITFAYVLQELLRRTAAPALPPLLLPWITIEEAAAATGLSSGFLRRQIKDGKVEAVRGGPHGRLRIRRASLEMFAG